MARDKTIDNETPVPYVYHNVSQIVYIPRDKHIKLNMKVDDKVQYTNLSDVNELSTDDTSVSAIVKFNSGCFTLVFNKLVKVFVEQGSYMYEVHKILHFMEE
jgi:hypothetical protein